MTKKVSLSESDLHLLPYTSYQLINVERNLILKHPITMLVAGATSSGKTLLVRKILKHFPDLTNTEKKPINVVWAYGNWQKEYGKPLGTPYVNIRYTKGLQNHEGCDVLVIDDLMTSLRDSDVISDLFTKGSHHKNMTVIFIVQNLFCRGRTMRDVNLNAHYLLLTRNRRDLVQVQVLARQLYGETKFFMDAYKRAVLDRDYGYLLVDLTPQTLEEFRLRTNIVPPDFPIIIYQHVREPEKNNTDNQQSFKDKRRKIEKDSIQQPQGPNNAGYEGDSIQHATGKAKARQKKAKESEKV